MKKSVLRMLSVLLLSGIALAEPVTEPLQQFSGLVHNQKDGHSESFFIRDAKGWDDFVARIPKQRVQMKQPAPPSSDPLLKSCPIDFDHQTAVVAISNDVYLDAIILDVDGDDIHTEQRKQSGYGIGAKPNGIGRYSLWVIEKP